MGAFGLFVLGKAAWNALSGMPPEPVTMGAIAFLALMANAGVALMLYAFRNGDANMRSVWLCSRNDAIGNVAVMVAALGVWGTSTRWPDVVVAAILASLFLHSASKILRQALDEWRLTSDGRMEACLRSRSNMKRRVWRWVHTDG
jgi:Co/Zn/Cd efflux system component